VPIITSTGDELLVVSTSMTSKDPELQNKEFLLIFAVFGCSAHF